MSKKKGEALYVYRQDSGFLLATVNHFSNPVRISELKTVSTHDASGNPFFLIKKGAGGKKGFVECHCVVSDPGFLHHIHSVQGNNKSSSNSISEVVKQWLGNSDEDFFFQILDWETGDHVPVEEPTQGLMLISGMKSVLLQGLQDQIIESELFPRKLECSVVLMLGLIKKLIENSLLKPPVLLLEIYKDSGLLVIIPPDGKPLIRTLDAGETSMYEQIQKELSLKDILSAQKLMYSSTIDLSDISQRIVSPLYKEISSTIGLFEVETGLSIPHMFITNQSPTQNWIAEKLSHDLGMVIPKYELSQLCELLNVQVDEEIEWDMNDNRMLPLLAAMGVL